MDQASEITSSKYKETFIRSYFKEDDKDSEGGKVGKNWEEGIIESDLED